MYELIAANDSGWRWSEQLGLFLGLVDGKLRWITAEGTVLLTDGERAEEAYLARQQEQAARQQAERDRQQAEQERDALCDRLLRLGIDPEGNDLDGIDPEVQA